MTKQVLPRCQVISREIYLRIGVVLFALVQCLAITGISAQEQSETCPCFSSEEVDSIFQRVEQIAVGEGEIMCKAQDYSVELTGEITILDKNYAVSAQARVEWMDFDPGVCAFIDTQADPPVERNTRWPHPAPEATARLCYDIIASVIKKSDTSGKCMTM